jgi:GntR family transcriptional regulator / MocR family aminotransferase
MFQPDDLAPDRLVAEPIQRQLYQRVRDAIASGRLRPGERLPSARGLASQLGVARGTVDAALARLAGEGYVETRGPAGSFISPHLAAATLPPAARPIREAPPAPGAPSRSLPFQPGLPALDAFPRKLWSRVVAQSVRALAPPVLAYPDPAGWPPLRAAIAAYLGVSRGIACAPEQVFVTPGYQGALALIARARLAPGERVWVEDPGYALARQALRGSGAVLVPVPVDAEGLAVAEGVARAADARFALVTPTHQSPLGMALSLRRRLALLAWAAAAGAWIVEDDYDSEFRYAGPPLPALKSLDRGHRVLYAGSFSKVLFPALRLGYLVVPEPDIADFARAARSLQQGCPVLEQAAVARFMADGHFARHLRRMRGLYAARRAALAAAIAAEFGGAARIDPQEGGMHLLVRLPGTDDMGLAAHAAAAGLAPQPLSPLASLPGGEGGLTLGFANVDPRDALALAARLRDAVRDLLA